jgi:predicted ArsR family transcriptional regulator
MRAVDDRTLTERLDAVAPLAEPVRRALYVHVVNAGDPVGRDAAAAALGIGRALAAFHLDKLVEAGLLSTEYRRLSGRTGPGAGRPAKLYRRADTQVDVTLPERRDQVLASLFATALEAATPADPDSLDANPPRNPRAVLDDVAAAYGHEIGVTARLAAGPRATVDERLAAAATALGSMGYEAVAADGTVTLANCPFDRVARDHRGLVCATNTALMEGVAEGLGSSRIHARFDPEPGQRCCVLLER